MSTRSLTILTDEKGQEIAVIYRHSDGYPEGHGVDLAKLLVGRRIVDGIPLDATTEDFFNGANDMAAAVVTGLKVPAGVGGIYLYPAGTRDIGQDYVYTVMVIENTIVVEITDYNGRVFAGTPEELLALYERRDLHAERGGAATIEEQEQAGDDEEFWRDYEEERWRDEQQAEYDTQNPEPFDPMSQA